MEYSYEEEEGSDVETDLRPVARRTAKHIAAGEERPRINSSQQTTPTDGKYHVKPELQLTNNFHMVNWWYVVDSYVFSISDQSVLITVSYLQILVLIVSI